MPKWLTHSLIALLAAMLMSRQAPAADVNADRWVEIELYWFDPADVARSADMFWRRYAPLYRGLAGYKGVVLSIGLTADYVFEFDGDPDQVIALPDTKSQEVAHSFSGQLDGDTAARQRAWRARFAPIAGDAGHIAYGRWTYRALRQLTDGLRARARREGIADFRVASLAVGQDGAYGAVMPFARRHPEAFTRWSDAATGALSSSSHLDPANALHADPRPLGGLPAASAKGCRSTRCLPGNGARYRAPPGSTASCCAICSASRARTPATGRSAPRCPPCRRAHDRRVRGAAARDEAAEPQDADNDVLDRRYRQRGLARERDRP